MNIINWGGFDMRGERDEKIWPDDRLPCSSLLATLSAVFSDWRALLRSSSKTSNGLLPPANAEVDTLSDFLAVSSRRSSSSSSSTVDDRCGNSIDFKILPLNFREKRIRISTSTSSFTHTHRERGKRDSIWGSHRPE